MQNNTPSQPNLQQQTLLTPAVLIVAILSVVAMVVFSLSIVYGKDVAAEVEIPGMVTSGIQVEESETAKQPPK